MLWILKARSRSRHGGGGEVTADVMDPEGSVLLTHLSVVFCGLDLS